MAVLSPTTLLAWFDFGHMGLTQFLNSRNTYLGANDGVQLVGFGAPQLRANLALTNYFKDGPIGRHSYGRYVEFHSGAPHGVFSLSTFGDADNRAYYNRAAWTVAVVFRPMSVVGNQVLISKRAAHNTVDLTFSQRLMLSGSTLKAACASSASVQNEITIAEAVTTGKSYIAYMSKADGANLNAGIKEVGAASWLTATPTGSLTVLWLATADMYLNAQRNSSDTADQSHGEIDYNAACWWYSALTPAAIQAGIEDHFGIANPSAGYPRSRIVNA